jgi:hypothetical protein
VGTQPRDGLFAQTGALLAVELVGVLAVAAAGQRRAAGSLVTMFRTVGQLRVVVERFGVRAISLIPQSYGTASLSAWRTASFVSS